MADLYYQQGLDAEALDIYEQLARRGDNPAVSARIEELRGKLAAQPAAPSLYACGGERRSRRIPPRLFASSLHASAWLNRERVSYHRNRARARSQRSSARVTQMLRTRRQRTRSRALSSRGRNCAQTAERRVRQLRIAVLNGPNLNLLGTREPDIYGRKTLADVERDLTRVASELGAAVTFEQHNGEGELVTAVQRLRGSADGAIVNAGAYSHSSLALRDAFAAVAVPFVEVHVSNVHAREPERRKLVLASKAVGVVCGLGVYGYEAALRALAERLRAE